MCMCMGLFVCACARLCEHIASNLNHLNMSLRYINNVPYYVRELENKLMID